MSNQDTYDRLIDLTTTTDEARAEQRAYYTAHNVWLDTAADRRSNSLRQIIIEWPIENFTEWYNETVADYASWYAPLDQAAQLYTLYDELRQDEWATEHITRLALSYSVCPVHFVDYAICFEEADTECEQVRKIHPYHDT